jgi:AcrR family transcriptional regulator
VQFAKPNNQGDAEATTEGSVPRFPRRAATKADTRRRLVSAALTLCAEKGYEDTTVAEITALAGVTTRTFFFHFPTKADVLFDIPPEDLVLLSDLIVAQPPKYSEVRALEHAVTEWCLRTTLDGPVRHQLTRLLLRAATTSPALRGRQLDYNQTLVDLAAGALAKRSHEATPSLLTLTAARTVMRILHAIMIDWAALDADSLERTIHSHFDALHELFPTDRSAEQPRVDPIPEKGRPTRRGRS